MRRLVAAVQILAVLSDEAVFVIAATGQQTTNKTVVDRFGRYGTASYRPDADICNFILISTTLQKITDGEAKCTQHLRIGSGHLPLELGFRQLAGVHLEARVHLHGRAAAVLRRGRPRTGIRRQKLSNGFK